MTASGTGNTEGKRPEAAKPSLGQYRMSKKTGCLLMLVFFVGLSYVGVKYVKPTENTSPRPTHPPKSAPATAAPAPAQATTVVAPPPATVPVPSALPWLEKLRDLCGDYQRAANPLKKSAVFQEARQVLAKARVQKLQGTVRKIESNLGGGEAVLTLDVAGVVFRTVTYEEALGGRTLAGNVDEGTILSPINRDGAVYKAVANLAVGQCVSFTTRNGMVAAATNEYEHVCGSTFLMELVSIESCPTGD